MLLLTFLTKKTVQKNVPDRQDDSQYVIYPSISKYSDLSEEYFSFKEGKNILRGSKYYRNDIEKYSGIVVFFHGMMGGRNSYLTQIYSLAQAGFFVYAYDNLTCGYSDGHGWFSLYSSVKDMDTFFKYFKKTNTMNLPIYAIGHSWGGFTALSTIFKDYPVSKIVEMSGFFDPVQATADLSEKPLKGKLLLKLTNLRYYFKYAKRNIFKELGKTEKKILFTHGEEDKIVRYDHNYLEIYNKYKARSNFEFISVPKHKHQVFMTLRAEEYGNKVFFGGLNTGKIPTDSVDFDLFFEQDDEFMNKVIEFLKR